MSPVLRSKREIVLWVALLLILCGVFSALDYFDATGEYRVTTRYISPWMQRTLEGESESPKVGRTETERVLVTRFTWARETSVAVVGSLAVLLVYYYATYAVNSHAKRNGRNVVRWTTAFLVFSPVLAGIVYLLTWPRGKDDND